MKKEEGRKYVNRDVEAIVVQAIELWDCICDKEIKMQE